MIDYTYLTPYIDQTSGMHLKQDLVMTYNNVNNEFQSLNRLHSIRTSRNDDIEMISCLLIYLSNYYTLPDLDFPHSTENNNEKRLFFLQAYRKSYSLVRMCKFTKNKKHNLLRFCEEVEQISFTQEPDYLKLKAILTGLI